MKLKNVKIIIAITFVLLIGFVNHSDALQIVELNLASTETEFDGNRSWHSAYVRTDEPFAGVNWYVDGIWVDTTLGNGIKQDAYFNPYWLTGDVTGNDYDLEVFVYKWDGDLPDSDSRTWTVTVFEEKIDSGTKNTIGAYGYARVSRCHWSGQTASSSQYGLVWNSSNENVLGTVKFEFRVVQLRRSGTFKNQLYIPPVQATSKTLKPGESHFDSFSDSYSLPGGNWGEAGEKARIEVLTTAEARRGHIADEWNASASDDILIRD